MSAQAKAEADRKPMKHARDSAQYLVPAINGGMPASL